MKLTKRIWQGCIFHTALAVFFSTCFGTHAQTADSFNPGSDYIVDALALQTDGRILVGGSFGTLAGRACQSLGRLNVDGTLDTMFSPAVGGNVIALAVQPDGRILVGGSFTTLGGRSCTNLGRLNPNGTLDTSFNCGANGVVHAIALQPDGKIVVGGKFTALGGLVRNRIGRLNSNGTVDSSMSVGADDDVYALAIQPDGKILVGGLFTTLGGATRNYIGRLTSGGSLDASFNSSTDDTVLSLAVQSDGKILVGGFFSTLAGQSRRYLGRLNANGSLDAGFANPDLNPVASNCGVYSLVCQTDGKILVAGLFSNVGSISQNCVARLNPDGTPDNTFGDAGASFTVYALALQEDGQILIGGQFTTAGGQPRQHIARLNNPTPAAQELSFDGTNIVWLRTGSSPELLRASFDISTDGVNWQYLGDGQRIAGGWSLTGLTSSAQASIRARGTAAGGRENGSTWVLERLLTPLAISQHPIGRTNNAGSLASFRVQAGGNSPLNYQWCKEGVSLSDGTNIFGTQSATLMLSNVVGADMGGYTVIVSNASGAVTSSVVALGVIDPFISTNPVSRLVNVGMNTMFAVTAGGTTPLKYCWQKDGAHLLGATNSSLALNSVQWGDRGSYNVIVSNAFGSVTSTVATLTVNLTPADGFNPGANGEVQALAVQTDGKILVGGRFTTLGGYSRGRLGRLNANGTIDTNFTVGTGGGTYPMVSAIVFQPDGKIVIGGDFTSVGGVARTNIARLNTDGSVDTNFVSGAEGVATSAVSALALQRDGKILVGGWFATLGTRARLNIGRINPDGSVDDTFNPGATATYPGVYALALQHDGRILVGGSFTSLAGQPRNRIGRLNTNGSLDTAFNPGASGSVFSLAVQADNRILVGGLFSSIGGLLRSNIARLNADGSPDPGFNPGASWSVFSLAVQVDGKIVVGGAFTTLAGQGRPYLGRLNPNGTLDPAFAASTSGYVNAVTLQPNGQTLVGGSFMYLTPQFRNNLGRLTNSEPATQSLTYDGANVTWLRGGSSPEAAWTTFEASTDGTHWTNWGDPARVTGGWSISNAPVIITNTTLRARAFLQGGYHNGSGTFVENTLLMVPRTPPQIVLNGSQYGAVLNRFGFSIAGLAGQTVVVEGSTNMFDWQPLNTITLGASPVEFWDDDFEKLPRRFYRARLQ